MVPESARAEVVMLCGDAEVATWSLVCRDGVGLAVVDELARVALDARRQGCSVRLRQACPDLVGLLQLVGLAGVLQVGGQPEEGEEVGVEEVVVPDDPVA